MKKLIFSLSMALLIGCAGKKENNQQTTYTATPEGLSSIQQSAPKNLTSSTNQAASNLITNPKHGEPGHRCDIAVGAPLNAPAKQAPKPQAIAAPTTKMVSNNKGQTTSTTGQALNPKHGAPGHRCDIAVGAPLNAVAKPTQSPNVTPNVSTAAPAMAAPQATSNSSNQKLNPAHGQPGHRCELAVGAPLN